MSVENLDKIFQPKSIAVVGAALMHNLIERGFAGEIHPINPNHKKIGKLPDQYEEHTQTSAGSDIFVRPIRPEDASLLIELFESLSP